MTSAVEILSPDGPIAAALDNYEPRSQQIDMAAAVEKAFEDCDHLMVEAGTGVGKSFAYLVAAIIAAATRNQRVVISTFTISLQEQLINKDLPFLAKVLDYEFTAVLGKGRSNYICLRRMDMFCRRADKLATPEEIDQLADLADWAATTEKGSIQEVDFPVDPKLWSKICCEKSSCMSGRCSLKGKCFFQAARQKILKADIVVVNHAMLFSDLALRERDMTILGPYDLAIIDEAHTAESVACDHFGFSISRGAIRRVLRELYDAHNNRGLLALMEATDAAAMVNVAWAAADDFFDDMVSFTSAGGGRSGSRPSGRYSPLDENLPDDQLSESLKKLSNMLRQLSLDIPADSERIEMVSRSEQLAAFVENLKNLVHKDREDHAYWVTQRYGEAKTGRRQVMDIYLSCAPIEAGPYIRSALMDAVNSVIFTSATLCTARGFAGGFDYMRNRLGADDCQELQLDSPFDYRKQVKLFVQSNLGDPNNMDVFVPRSVAAMLHFIDMVDGGCFILFTSYAMMQQAAELLESQCARRKRKLFVQGRKMGAALMLEKFRTAGNGVLLGTVSFWQGVDVPGDALSAVIITKLPFAAPDSPLVEARMESIVAAGGNSFMQYQVPEAVIRFRQGFGRLVRGSNDTGLVAVLDHRIVSKRYGSIFLKSLPQLEIIRDEYQISF